MTQYVHFTMGEPLTLSLASTEAEMDRDGWRWNYPTTEGKILSVSREIAARINLLELKPNQPFCIEKVFVGPKEPGPSWRVWLPINKPVDVPPPSDDLEKQLAASIELVQARKPVRRHVQASPDQERFPGMHRGNGTYGRAPQPVPQLATCGPIPYAIALDQITGVVLETLKKHGEQWESGAKQDLVSTLLIQAARDGRVVFDFHTEEKS